MSDIAQTDCLDPRISRRARTLADRLDPEDFDSVLQYGLPVQVRLAGIADEVMTRLDMSGKERAELAALLERLARLDPAVSSGRGLFGLPLLGRGPGSEDRLLDRYDRMCHRLDRLLPELEAACRQLGQTLTRFDRLHERNQAYLEDLEVLVAGARLRRDDFQRELLPGMIARSQGGDLDNNHLEGLSRLVERLERRIADLESAAATARETGPTIRRIQDDLRGLMLEAQQTSLTTAMCWKHSFADAVTRLRRGENPAFPGHAADRRPDPTTDEPAPRLHLRLWRRLVFVAPIGLAAFWRG